MYFHWILRRYVYFTIIFGILFPSLRQQLSFHRFLSTLLPLSVCLLALQHTRTHVRIAHFERHVVCEHLRHHQPGSPHVAGLSRYVFRRHVPFRGMDGRMARRTTGRMAGLTFVCFLLFCSVPYFTLPCQWLRGRGGDIFSGWWSSRRAERGGQGHRTTFLCQERIE